MEQCAVKFNCGLAVGLHLQDFGAGIHGFSMHEYRGFWERNPQSDHEFESIAIALDVSAVEMAADHEHWPVGKTGE
jgi:hypothetical protein